MDPRFWGSGVCAVLLARGGGRQKHGVGAGLRLAHGAEHFQWLRAGSNGAMGCIGERRAREGSAGGRINGVEQVPH